MPLSNVQIGVFTPRLTRRMLTIRFCSDKLLKIELVSGDIVVNWIGSIIGKMLFLSRVVCIMEVSSDKFVFVIVPLSKTAITLSD